MAGISNRIMPLALLPIIEKIVELNDLLNEFNLRIKRGKLVGEEKQIRFFFLIFLVYL